MLRLPREVLPVFDERLEQALPERANKVRNALREMRGGAMNESAFGARFRGQGARWEMIEQLFETHCRKLGMNAARLIEEDDAPATTFKRPSRQGVLFEV